MKQRLLFVVLVASLAFNVFFAMGYMEATRYVELSKTFAGRSQIFADELGLDTDQQKAYQQLHDRFMRERQERRDANREQYDLFWQEIVKDEPDEEALTAFVQVGAGTNFRERFVRHMRDLMSILRPDQRRLAVELMQKRFGRTDKKPSASS